MPLNTQILRDGEIMKLRWGGFHVAAMVMAASADSGEGPYKDMPAFVKEARALMAKQGSIGVNPGDVFSLTNYYIIAETPLNSGDYTLKEAWSFQDNVDGELLELKPGDVLKAYRSHSG